MARTVWEELADITSTNGGAVTAEAVVTFAKKHPDSALHGRFDWNDASAAHRHRLDTARGIIRDWYVLVDDSPPKMVRAVLSLPSDREGGNGYRDVKDCLRDSALRKELVKTALTDIKAELGRFDYLPELQGAVRKLTAICDAELLALDAPPQKPVSRRAAKAAEVRAQV